MFCCLFHFTFYSLLISSCLFPISHCFCLCLILMPYNFFSLLFLFHVVRCGFKIEEPNGRSERKQQMYSGLQVNYWKYSNTYSHISYIAIWYHLKMNAFRNSHISIDYCRPFECTESVICYVRVLKIILKSKFTRPLQIFWDNTVSILQWTES